jgi:spore maturation protein SpmB
MSWFTDLFSSGVSKVVDSVGAVIDDLHTSDEEKLALKQKIEIEMNKFRIEQMNAQAKYDQEITKRWTSDNEFQVTRLVRPLSFTAVLVLFGAVILTDGNIGEFSIKAAYIPVLEGLLYTMVVAYFGSRGAEKITKTIKK